MLKIKVIADNILNLTDARYFAAYGVDHLVFNLEHIAPSAIQEIKEWVEGVSILLDTNSELTPGLLDLALSLSLDGFVSGKVELLNELSKQLPEAQLFLREADDKLFSYRDSKKDLKPYIRATNSTGSLEATLSSDTIAGIIVEGEPEEKVGFKNFDQLDEIFDLLSV